MKNSPCFPMVVKSMLLIFLFIIISYMGYYFTTPWLSVPSELPTPKQTVITARCDKSQYGSSQLQIPITIHNGSCNQIQFQRGTLEIKQDDVWYGLQFKPYATTLELKSLAPNESETIIANLDHYGPRLRPGHYRIIIDIYSPAGFTTAEFYIV